MAEEQREIRRKKRVLDYAQRIGDNTIALLLTYKDDVHLEKKLAAWEQFYNYDRPHGAHKGKTPYEALREKPS